MPRISSFTSEEALVATGDGSRSAACFPHYSWVEKSPSGKMPNPQGKFQKGAQVSLMAWAHLKCLLCCCLALEALSSLKAP